MATAGPLGTVWELPDVDRAETNEAAKHATLAPAQWRSEDERVVGVRGATRRHSTRETLDGSVGDGPHKLSVVSLVLVGVQAGEVAHRGGKLHTLPDVAVDGYWIARACVGPGKRFSTGSGEFDKARCDIAPVVGMIFMSRNCRT